MFNLFYLIKSSLIIFLNMAETQPEHASIFPPPPIYYKNYKDVNIILDKSTNISNMYIVDTDNINLKPPEIPNKLIDLYKKVKDIKLPDDIPILYKTLDNGNIDYVNSLPLLFDLLKSQYSIFLNTLLMSNDPLSPYLLDSLLRIDNTNAYIQQSKILSNSVSKEVNQLRYIYSNISFLINSMRYHQAKVSLLVAMKNQYNMLENYHKELLEYY